MLSSTKTYNLVWDKRGVSGDKDTCDGNARLDVGLAFDHCSFLHIICEPLCIRSVQMRPTSFMSMVQTEVLQESAWYYHTMISGLTAFFVSFLDVQLKNAVDGLDLLLFAVLVQTDQSQA